MKFHEKWIKTGKFTKFHEKVSRKCRKGCRKVSVLGHPSYSNKVHVGPGLGAHAFLGINGVFRDPGLRILWKTVENSDFPCFPD